jgi:hypothetical protein
MRERSRGKSERDETGERSEETNKCSESVEKKEGSATELHFKSCLEVLGHLLINRPRKCRGAGKDE